MEANFVIYAQPENEGFVTGTRKRIKGVSIKEWSIWMWILIAINGSCVASIGLPSAYFTYHILTYGVETDAVMVDQRIMSGKDTVYYVTYQFSVGAAVYEVEQDVGSADNYERLSLGSRVTVRYLTSSPLNARLSGQFEVAGESLVGYIVFGLLALLAVTMLARTEWESRRFSRYGKLLDGVLVATSGRGGSRDGHIVSFSYKFQSPSGVELDGVRKVTRQDLRYKSLPKSGSPVKVLYISDKNHRML